jgi:hypothetical protein
VLRGPTGRVVVHTEDADRAVGLLGSRVAQRDGDRLIVADADPAGVNAQLTTAGLRITEIWPERRSLEELVLSVTTGSSDRFDGADRARRRQAASGPGPIGLGGTAAGDGVAESGDQAAVGARAADGDTAVEAADATAAGETAATGESAAGSGEPAAGR